MDIKILGSRGEIPRSAPYHSKHSGVLIDGKLLLDLGEEEYLELNPKYILITHLHPDHAFFIKGNIPDKISNMEVYAPETFLNCCKIAERSFKLGPYQITSIPILHSIKTKSFAYLVEKGKKRILYTGDVAWIRKEFQRKLGKLDLVIAEGSYIRKGGLVRRDKETGRIYGHTGIPNLVNVFKEYADKMIFIHFGSWFYRDINESRKKLEILEEENRIEILVGYDGMEMKI